MKALITGGAGFIGSHLADALLAQGWAVSIIDDLSTGRKRNFQHLIERDDFSFVIESIMNEALMDRLVAECDVVFHLASAVGVDLIVKKPVEVIERCILGTEIVLRMANRYKKKVLFTSSSEVYGKNSKTPFSEDDDCLLGPTSKSRWSYACSKAADEFLALAYFKEKELPVIIVRLFNTVGPRQSGRYGMVLPRFIEQALAGKPLTLFGDGAQSRCFTDVSDVVGALISLTEHPEAPGEIFNIGTTEETSIQQLAERVIAITESASRIEKIPYEDAYEAGFEDMRRRVPNIKKIQSLIGYLPQISLERTILKMKAYYNAGAR